MPTPNIMELADAQVVNDLREAYGEAKDEQDLRGQLRRLTETEKILRELMRSDRSRPRGVPNLSMKEAVHSADFKILFPKVISDTLQQPIEPTYIGQGLLARTIQVDGARIMEFPTLGAIRAFELADSQEPPEQDPAFSKNITEIRVRRFGLKLEFSNEVLDESQWDILALYTNAAGNAMMRKKEELIFNEYETRAITIFNNASTNTALHTTGVGSDGTTPNATFDHMDLLDMMAALGTNGYNPTDVIVHPMAWAIWAKDPFLRFQLMYKGGVGQTLGNFSQEPAGIQTYMPFGLNVVVSPFQTIAYNTSLSTGLSGFTSHYSTITVVDRNSSLLVLQRTPMSMVQWENPIRDIRSMAFHEKYGLSILNGGRSAVVAKNVRIAVNYQPLYTIRTVTAS
jgi:hypothetical protein